MVPLAIDPLLPCVPDLDWALALATWFSARSALSVASSSSCWALRNLAKLSAAISSASSICLL